MNKKIIVAVLILALLAVGFFLFMRNGKEDAPATEPVVTAAPATEPPITEAPVEKNETTATPAPTPTEEPTVETPEPTEKPAEPTQEPDKPTVTATPEPPSDETGEGMEVEEEIEITQEEGTDGGLL